MTGIQHECGVAAVYHFEGPDHSPLVPKGDPEKASSLIPRMLLDLQNRGQLAAGLTAYCPTRGKVLDSYKQLGPVIEAFRLNHPGKQDSILKEHRGRAAIGHVRYATCGPDGNDRDLAQPFTRYHGRKWKWFSMAFNGQLANFQALAQELEQSGYHLMHGLDTEVIMHYLSYELRNDDEPDLVQVFSHLSEKFDGAYNIVYLNALGEMVVARDPLGFRPLCYAREGPLFAAASESTALSNLGFSTIHSLQPGELILIKDNQLSIHRFAPNRRTAHCFFEWIYFANVASTLDGHSVYLSRAELGHELANQEHALNLVPMTDDTIVVPVPDTGKAAADSMAFHLGLQSVEGLMRNRHLGRTFIEGKNREDKVRLKFTPLREVMHGKRVILVEDSIVRSTTLKSLLKLIRERGGAREIHVRVACPPIVAPCFYGIDMSTVRELFAPRFMRGKMITHEEQRAMAVELGADSLYYLPLDAIARCIGIPNERLCRACLTGEYPTPTGSQLYELALLNHEHGETNGRTYDSRTEARNADARCATGGGT